MGFGMETKELKRMGVVLQELGLSYAETLEVLHEMSKNANNAKKLWRGEKKSNLIKLALTLITFPEPTPISETIGAAVLVAGLVQNRVKKATLHVEDVYKTFQDVNNDILKIRQFRT
jgi:hypothetical protein